MTINKENYELLLSKDIAEVNVEKWILKRTGMTVYRVKSPGPVVSGELMIRTETRSNNGCPHTLEHLVFLGSEEYPYKGFLDLYASKRFAEGTNAWTDIDSTVYTLDTSGSEGFLQTLPVYMDHILFPLITQEGFHTEIHHITGEGKNAGVVYCEMQARENDKDDISSFRRNNLLYKNDTGYRYETGGLIADIRKLDADTIRQYHRDYYRPENVGIYVCGDVETDQIFEVLEPIEQKILARNAVKPPTPFVRPWQTEAIPFDQSITEEILFKSTDESTGEVSITFMSNEYTNQLNYIVISILLKYLAEGSYSPIYQQMIDIEDPYAAEISIGDLTLSRKITEITFISVKVEKLESIRPMFYEILNEIYAKQDIDMDLLSTIIENEKNTIYYSIESSPSSTFSGTINCDFLYYNDVDQLDKELDMGIFEELKAKDKSYWLDILKTWVIDQPYIELLLKPSIQEAERLIKEEEERTQKQIASYTPEQLKAFGDELDRCQTFNNLPFDQELFNKVKPPLASSIKFIPVVNIVNDVPRLPDNEEYIKLNNHIQSQCSSKLPFEMLLSHGPSSFSQAGVLLNTANVPDELRDYLPLFFESLFSLPVVIDGEEIGYEEMSVIYQQYFLSSESNLGCGNSRHTTFQQYGTIFITTLNNNYEKGVSLLHSLLNDVVFNVERISMTAQQYYDCIPEEKNSPTKMLNGLAGWFNVDPKQANEAAKSLPRQEVFLKRIIEELDDEVSAQVVVDNFKRILKIVTEPSAMSAFVGSNLYKLNNPKKIWIDKFGSTTSPITTLPIITTVLSDGLLNLSNNNGYVDILPVPGATSSFFNRTLLTPFRPKDMLGREFYALNLICFYLDQMEGPFFKGLRGAGLCYGYGMSTNREKGTISFHVSKSTNLEAAYLQSKKIIQDLVDSGKFDQSMLESARNTLIFDITNGEKDAMGKLKRQVWNVSVRQWPETGYFNVLDFIYKITEEELWKAMKYIIDLFDDKKSYVAIVDDPSKVESIKGFLTHDKVNVVSLETHFV